MVSKEVFREVALMGADMVIGDQRGGLECPACHGGPNKDKAFSLYKGTTHFKFICHRASCGFTGSTPHNSTAVVALPAPEKPKTNPFKGEYHDIEHTYLQDRFHIDAVGCKWWPAAKRVLFPVMSKDYHRIGWVARGYEDLGFSGAPKSLNFVEDTSEPFMHFPMRQNWQAKSAIVITEDWVSAECVAKHHTAASIQGTNFSSDIAVHLNKSGFKTVYLAFDKDAWHKYAFVYSKFRLLFEDVIGVTWQSGVDPKDMSIEELASVFNESHLLSLKYSDFDY